MTKKNFLINAALTAMDIVVFILCVDKGLTPVTIVGACYMALRVFSRDAQAAIDASDEWISSIHEKFVSWKENRKLKETEEDPEVVDES